MNVNNLFSISVRDELKPNELIFFVKVNLNFHWKRGYRCCLCDDATDRTATVAFTIVRLSIGHGC